VEPSLGVAIVEHQEKRRGASSVYILDSQRKDGGSDEGKLRKSHRERLAPERGMGRTP
jgi:hypothetical protein